jgi:hypothetical protein
MLLHIVVQCREASHAARHFSQQVLSRRNLQRAVSIQSGPFSFSHSSDSQSGGTADYAQTFFIIRQLTALGRHSV